MALPQMVSYDANTNTFIDVDGYHWAFDGQGNPAQVPDTYVNPYTAAPAVIAETTGDTGNNYAQLATSALTALQTYQLNQINVQRATQGLPPINTAAYGMGVNVGLTQDTQKLVMYGGLALLAFLVFNSLSKR